MTLKHCDVTMFEKTKLKYGALSILGLAYFASFWIITVGYFTSHWLNVDMSWVLSESHDNFGDYSINNWHECSSIGFVIPTLKCDERVANFLIDKNIHNVGHLLRVALILMTIALCIVYTNAIMLVLDVVYDLMEYSLFNSILSISFGILYPVAAVLILGTTLFLKVSYRHSTGYSVNLCIVAGCLMLFIFICLILYDQYYVRIVSKLKNSVKPLKSDETPEHDTKCQGDSRLSKRPDHLKLPNKSIAINDFGDIQTTRKKDKDEYWLSVQRRNGSFSVDDDTGDTL